MTPLPEAFEAALLPVARALYEAGVEWRLGGSAMLAARAFPVEVGDLDVTVSADTLAAVEEACRPWLVETLPGPAPPPWCSDWLIRLVVADVDVDVIGGFCVQTDRGRVPVPDDQDGSLHLEDLEVPLADPAVWWWVYTHYKPEKARLLAEVVPAERRRELERRLGVS